MSFELTMTAGDTRYVDIDIADDTNGWTIWFVAKESPADLDNQAPIFKYSGSGVATINATNGQYRATIAPADTDQYVDTGQVLEAEWQVLTDGGEIYTVEKGTITIETGLTRQTSPGAPLILGEPESVHVQQAPRLNPYQMKELRKAQPVNT